MKDGVALLLVKVGVEHLRHRRHDGPAACGEISNNGVHVQSSALRVLFSYCCPYYPYIL